MCRRVKLLSLRERYRINARLPETLRLLEELNEKAASKDSSVKRGALSVSYLENALLSKSG